MCHRSTACMTSFDPAAKQKHARQGQQKTKGRIRRSDPLPSYPVRYLQTGSPSPAPEFTGLVVATEIPQVTPGSCGCVSVADQYDVLGVTFGVPTPEVEENELSSVSFA